MRVLLKVEDTPRRIALAFGLGVFIALFPVLGVHTALALGIGFVFRLSRVALLLGAYVNNPWTIAPLYMAGTVVGCVLLGVRVEDLSGISWSYAGLERFLWPFVVGNLVLGSVAGVASYYALWGFLSRRRADGGPAGPDR